LQGKRLDAADDVATGKQTITNKDQALPVTSERTSHFTESIIRRMTRVANSCDAINLSQGFPDFDPPEALLAAAERSARQGPHQYAVTWGARNFRQAFARKQSRFMGIDIDPETNVVVTCGSTEAMMAAMMTACNPGDRVVIFSPFYENYTADTVLAGAIPVYVPLAPPEFNFDPGQLRQAFEEHRPKALVLCNPGNPTGKVFSREELEFIASLAIEFDTFVITDEVYEHIVYAPHQHVSIAGLTGMFERTITCGSLSKTYSITGWRLGTVVASPVVVDVIRKVHDFLTVGAAAPLQEAAVTALEFPDEYYSQFLASYTEKRDLFLGWLDKAGLSYTRPQGAYYVMVDVGEFSVTDDVAFCEWLTREVGVAAVPGSSFFREPVHNWIRFHFAKRVQTLDAAGERLMHLRAKAGGFSND
jgi:aminotransferase